MIEAEAAKNGVASDFNVLKKEFEVNSDKVIDLLIENCMNVDISIPRVVRGNFEEQEKWVQIWLIREHERLILNKLEQ